jgi:4-oxalocrotonate tautomerase
MPVITVAMGQKSTEVKKELIAALTSTAAAVTGIPEAKFIVLLEELSEDAIGVGGKSLQEIRSGQA